MNPLIAASVLDYLARVVGPNIVPILKSKELRAVMRDVAPSATRSVLLPAALPAIGIAGAGFAVGVAAGMFWADKQRVEALQQGVTNLIGRFRGSEGHAPVPPQGNGNGGSVDPTRVS